MQFIGVSLLIYKKKMGSVLCHWVMDFASSLLITLVSFLFVWFVSLQI